MQRRLRLRSVNFIQPFRCSEKRSSTDLSIILATNCPINPTPFPIHTVMNRIIVVFPSAPSGPWLVPRPVRSSQVMHGTRGWDTGSQLPRLYMFVCLKANVCVLCCLVAGKCLDMTSGQMSRQLVYSGQMSRHVATCHDIFH